MDDETLIVRLRDLAREWLDEASVAQSAGRGDIRDIYISCVLEVAELFGERTQYTQHLKGGTE